MINDLTLSRGQISLCEHRSVDIKTQRLEYFLYSVITASGKEYYALEACNEDLFEFGVIGDELGYAKELYQRIVEGKVSPICLDDVIHDMKMSKKY